jgi:hypothetical protein
LVESICTADRATLDQYRDSLYDQVEKDPASAQSRLARIQRAAINWRKDALSKVPPALADDKSSKIRAIGRRLERALALNDLEESQVVQCQPQGWTPLFGSNLADFMGGWMTADAFWNRK